MWPRILSSLILNLIVLNKTFDKWSCNILMYKIIIILLLILLFSVNFLFEMIKCLINNKKDYNFNSRLKNKIFVCPPNGGRIFVCPPNGGRTNKKSKNRVHHGVHWPLDVHRWCTLPKNVCTTWCDRVHFFVYTKKNSLLTWSNSV